MLNTNRKQYAALPYRLCDEERLQVMLITSRGTGRWVVPKGWPMVGLKPWRAAAREAYEEAGIIGAIEKRAAGRYDYQKRFDDGTVTTCEVEVFPLRVEEELPRWPEQDQRTRRWFSPEEASILVDEEGLQSLLAELTKAGGLGRSAVARDDDADREPRPRAQSDGKSKRRIQVLGDSVLQTLRRRKVKDNH